MGLPKGARLTDSPEFERVYKQGVAYRGTLISVHAFPSNAGEARLGVSVSKKVGNAVQRNAVKRRLREIFRAELPDIQHVADFVISARPAAAEARYEDLQEEFGKALRKLRGRGELGS